MDSALFDIRCWGVFLLMLLLGIALFFLIRQIMRRIPKRFDTVASHREVGHTLVAPPEEDTERWIALAERCVVLFSEMELHSPAFEPGCREIANYTCARLQQILEQSGVEIIVGEATFDNQRHQVEYPLCGAAGAPIEETLSPGFAVQQRILRRARVRLAEIVS